MKVTLLQLKKMQLVNMVSMMAVPEDAKDDILNRDHKGQSQYKDFVTNRLITDSPMSLWDPIVFIK